MVKIEGSDAPLATPMGPVADMKEWPSHVSKISNDSCSPAYLWHTHQTIITITSYITHLYVGQGFSPPPPLDDTCHPKSSDIPLASSMLMPS